MSKYVCENCKKQIENEADSLIIDKMSGSGEVEVDGYLAICPECLKKIVPEAREECKSCLYYEICNAIGLVGIESTENIKCVRYKDRSRFVELPDDFPKGRLTTDNPLGNFDALMNYAYAKDGNVLIRYANNQENMDLCDYIAHHAKCDCAINAQEVLDGACFECDDFYCPLGRAYFASVQAAELRERLKMYEDLAEQALKERES